MRMTTADAATLSARVDFEYASCYCEENCWLLCRALCAGGRALEADLVVVFLSNPEQQVGTNIQSLLLCHSGKHSQPAHYR